MFCKFVNCFSVQVITCTNEKLETCKTLTIKRGLNGKAIDNF